MHRYFSTGRDFRRSLNVILKTNGFSALAFAKGARGAVAQAVNHVGPSSMQAAARSQGLASGPALIVRASPNPHGPCRPEPFRSRTDGWETGGKPAAHTSVALVGELEAGGAGQGNAWRRSLRAN